MAARTVRIAAFGLSLRGHQDSPIRPTLLQVVLRPSIKAFVATVILSLQVFSGQRISLLANFGGCPVTSKTVKPGKKSTSGKDQEKRTAKTIGGGPKKGEPDHTGGVIVNPS